MKPRTTVLQFAAAGCLALSAAGAAEGGVAVIAHRGWHQAPGVKGADISLVSVFRRTSSVVSFFVGGLLFRDLDLRRKAFALLLVLAGAALAALG